MAFCATRWQRFFLGKGLKDVTIFTDLLVSSPPKVLLGAFPTLDPENTLYLTKKNVAFSTFREYTRRQISHISTSRGFDQSHQQAVFLADCFKGACFFFIMILGGEPEP